MTWQTHSSVWAVRLAAQTLSSTTVHLHIAAQSSLHVGQEQKKQKGNTTNWIASMDTLPWPESLSMFRLLSLGLAFIRASRMSRQSQHGTGRRSGSLDNWTR